MKERKRLYPATTQPGKSTDVGDRILRQAAKPFPFPKPPFFQSSVMDISIDAESAKKVMEEFQRRGVKMTMTHDEIFFEGPKVEIEEASERVKAIMKDVPVFPLPPLGLPVVDREDDVDQGMFAAQMFSKLSKQLDDAKAEIAELETINTELDKTNIRLQDSNSELRAELDNLQKSYNVLSDLTMTTNQMFMFLAGLDLQDHPIADQRKFMRLFQILKRDLKQGLETVGKK